MLKIIGKRCVLQSLTQTKIPTQNMASKGLIRWRVFNRPRRVSARLTQLKLFRDYMTRLARVELKIQARARMESQLGLKQ